MNRVAELLLHFLGVIFKEVEGWGLLRLNVVVGSRVMAGLGHLEKMDEMPQAYVLRFCVMQYV